mmetsp:Transcript_27120/g.35553  ORF Transcript_27120/g.35553 Transcript_27120/m.35553 type:complete len:264 (+) Transcript_27120:1116-1907(+)
MKTYTRETVSPLRVEFPNSRVEKTLTVPMVEALCITSKTFPIICGGASSTKGQRLEDNLLVEFVRTVLERRLLETLRFELGSIYTVNVSVTYSVSDPALKDSDPIQGLLIITLTCKPKDVESIHAKIMQDIEDLAKSGPTEEEVKHAVEAHKRERETAMRTNAYWSNVISRAYSSPRYTGNIVATFQETCSCTEQLYSTLDSKRMHQAFQKFFGKCQRMTTSTLKAEPLTKQLMKWTMVGGAIIAAIAGTTYLLKNLKRTKIR